ncbi:Acyl-protein thioesterase 1 [Neolecta irregularis DAH-3]|uniref:Acyl-protein thioesterase 1 n=1 Tax=Neolecta irregularis (strain DAH-3) TaxID=1198029 RepID=A0A1U7LM02_NEOID|nr:Acyl-protein thioesterase 1 [Neolecta irregularis DAH-3]|eukprot:OLL23572.1 Acyl-protein thioesterase 1 [Neolecta irregularis DAH-3]
MEVVSGIIRAQSGDPRPTTMNPPAKSAIVIFLHGLGDSGAGWRFLPEYFKSRSVLGHVRWVLPSAPTIPVTLNGGTNMPGWYDILSLSDSARSEDESGMAKTVKYIHSLVDQQISNGFPAHRIVLGGFSQGPQRNGPPRRSDLSKDTRRNSLPQRLSAPARQNTPERTIAQLCLFLCATALQTRSSASSSARMVRDTLGMNVEWHEYPGLQHSAHEEEFDHVAVFLQRVIRQESDSRGPSSDFIKVASQGDINYTSQGAEFVISKIGDSPTLDSQFYILYGKVSVEMKPAPGVGVVSSFIWQSDTLDEIDLEWLGGDNFHVQSNYFFQGNTSFWSQGVTHGGLHDASNVVNQFHTYEIDWTSDQIVWSINGVAVRTLTKASTLTNGVYQYPQSPSQIKIGSWVAGVPGTAEGTIQWAGGLTDFSQAPFTMVVRRFDVKSYTPTSSYSFSGTSGLADSITENSAENSHLSPLNTSSSQTLTASTVGKSTIKSTSNLPPFATIVVPVAGIAGNPQTMTPSSVLPVSTPSKNLTTVSSNTSSIQSPSGTPSQQSNLKNASQTLTVSMGLLASLMALMFTF